MLSLKLTLISLAIFALALVLSLALSPALDILLWPYQYEDAPGESWRSEDREIGVGFAIFPSYGVASAAFRNGTVVDIAKVDAPEQLKIFMATGEDPSFSLAEGSLATHNPVLPLLAELKVRTVDALGKPFHSADVSSSITTAPFVAAILESMTQLSLVRSGWSRLNGHVIVSTYLPVPDDWDPWDVDATEETWYALYIENTAEAMLIAIYKVESEYRVEHLSYHTRFGQARMRQAQPASIPIIEAELITSIGRALQEGIDPRAKLDLIIFAGDGAADARVRRIAHDAARLYLPSQNPPKMVPDVEEDATFQASRESARLHKATHSYERYMLLLH